MADYYAVLKRTLDGLGETRPELRQTLYERARLTIGRQLEASDPPLAAEAVAAEKAGLENAIVQIEQEIAGRSAIIKPAPLESDTHSGPEGNTDTSAELTQVPVSAPIHPSPAPVAVEQPPLTPVAAPDGEALGVPMPAPANNKPGRTGFYVLIVFLILMVGAASAALWSNKDALMAMFEPSAVPETGTKKVKTISVTVQPEEKQAAAADTPSDTTEKFDTRLTESGEEVTAKPVPTSPVTLQPLDEDPLVETPAAAPTEIEMALVTPPTLQPSIPTTGAVVAQKAFLYEEGGSPANNSVDVGAVVWSVVNESPGSGQPEEPAIRAKVEIFERNLVLILTIKRNADSALPASHLIELIFAVPDNFAGGSIENVQRFVFKQSEQERGDALIAVPAKIADGIFLIALNNLEQAIARNTSLMKDREWIDIPLGYRSGRRALITLEKGIPGERVFKEVLSAWQKLSTTTAGN